MPVQLLSVAWKVRNIYGDNLSNIVLLYSSEKQYTVIWQQLTFINVQAHKVGFNCGGIYSVHFSIIF